MSNFNFDFDENDILTGLTFMEIFFFSKVDLFWNFETFSYTYLIKDERYLKYEISI